MYRCCVLRDDLEIASRAELGFSDGLTSRVGNRHWPETRGTLGSRRTQARRLGRGAGLARSCVTLAAS